MGLIVEYQRRYDKLMCSWTLCAMECTYDAEDEASMYSKSLCRHKRACCEYFLLTYMYMYNVATPKFTQS